MTFTKKELVAIALVSVLTAAIIFVGGYNSGNVESHYTAKDKPATKTIETTPQYEKDFMQEYEKCALVIILTHDFNPYYCKGIAEDDPLLASTYDYADTHDAEYVKVGQ